jgi:hypothetical protein
MAMLAMFHTRQEFQLGGFLTFQCVGDDHMGDVLVSLQQLAEECLRGLLVTPLYPINPMDARVRGNLNGGYQSPLLLRTP